MTDQAMPFMDHLGELRSRLVKSLIGVGVGTLAAFTFHEQIIEILARPYEIAVDDAPLAFFRPTEAFSLAMSIALFGGVILASPVILYQTWRFIAPALTPREKRWAVPLTAVFVALFLAGVLAGYWALARGLGFLLGFGGDSLEPVIGAEFYLSFAMRFVLAFGIAFEFPVFLFAAAAFGAIGSRQLRRGRRWTVLVIVVAAAFITPSGDPLTMLLLAVPLYVLYEVTILAIRFILKR